MKFSLISLPVFLSLALFNCDSSSGPDGSLTTDMTTAQKAQYLQSQGACQGFIDLIQSQGNSQGSPSRQFRTCLASRIPNQADIYTDSHTRYLNGETPYEGLTTEVRLALDVCYCPTGGEAVAILLENPVVRTWRQDPSGGLPNYNEESSDPGTLYNDPEDSPGDLYDEESGGVGDVYHNESSSP